MVSTRKQIKELKEKDIHGFNLGLRRGWGDCFRRVIHFIRRNPLFKLEEDKTNTVQLLIDETPIKERSDHITVDYWIGYNQRWEEIKKSLDIEKELKEFVLKKKPLKKKEVK